MKKFIINFKYLNYLIGALLLLILSCNKKFDEPPINADPEIPVTMTISELKAKYQSQGSFLSIEGDDVISGVVVADDRSGNFYKQIVIQDETGGIPIQIDMNSIYTSYPVGRKLFVKVKGLMLGDYGGNIQLGFDSTRSSDGRYLNLERIPQTLISKYITPGSYGNVVTPKIIKPSDYSGNVKDALLSTLVQINNAEFKDADLAKTYADPTQTTSAFNFTIKPCDDTKSVVLRNSSYATFAGLTVAQGNGPMVGILSVFNGTLQIAIRDTFDIQFKGQRCSGTTPVTTTKTIAEVLTYAKGDSVIPAGTWIEGTIVSDTKNESVRNYRLQDATAGIQLRFTSDGNPNAALGDKYAVYVGGLKLELYNGGMQINNAETSNKTGSGTVTPKIATIADIITAGRTWESQVVTIKDVTISGSGSNYSIKDATGEITTYVRATSGIAMPTAATSITGYISLYQSATTTSPVLQLVLRTQADIVGGTNNPTNPPAGEMGVDGTGTPTDPYSITQAIAKQGEKDVWVKGYIVGDVNGQSIQTGAEFNLTSWNSETNILIAINKDETDYTKCLVVQLPATPAGLRSSINLKQNPSNHKKVIYLKGSLEKYFGVAGLKSTSEYKFP